MILVKINMINNLIFLNSKIIKEMNIKKYIEIDMGIYIMRNNIIKQVA